MECAVCKRDIADVPRGALADSPKGLICRDCAAKLPKDGPVSERTSFDDRSDETPLKERELREEK